MSKLILHNMSLKGIENVPGVLDYDQRGILIAKDGDTLITRKMIDSDFIIYLESLGYDFSGVEMLNPNEEISRTYKSVFENKDLLGKLQNSNCRILDTYQLTSLEDDFADRLGVELEGNVSIALRVGTKTGFREFCERNNIPIPKGFGGLRTSEEVMEKIKELEPLTELCLLRLDEGVSGAGNFLISIKKFIKLERTAQIKQIEEYLNAIPQMQENSGITVEDWVENVLISPSLQYFIEKNGLYKLLSTADQLLEHDTKWYTGCDMPSQTLLSDYPEVVESANRFIEALANEGYWGHVGVDTIIDFEGNHYLVEANIRKQGTFYPREFVTRVFGELRNFMTKDYSVSKIASKSFSELKDLLQDIMINNPKDRVGILVYNTGAIEEGGRFDAIAIANSAQVRKALLDEVTRRVESL